MPSLTWRATFDAVNTPILITDGSGRVAQANRATLELTGLDESQITGRNLSQLAAKEPWQTAARMIAAKEANTAAETRDDLGRTWDITVTHSDGECILVLWSISGIVELQDSLRRSETMSAMGALVAGVAHEVRNPLFGMSATLDAFAEELSKPGYVECATALRTQVDRLHNLMNELLEYGKPSAPDIQRCKLATIVDNAIAQRGVRVMTKIPDDLPDVLADRDRLQQVFENLIDNASRFSKSIQVTASASGRWVECRVEDEGPGFAPEDLHRVFEPFYSRREGGTGLGLSLVQRIVQDHSGRVFAENREEGGARVRILLPCAK